MLMHVLSAVKAYLLVDCVMPIKILVNQPVKLKIRALISNAFEES